MSSPSTRGLAVVTGASSGIGAVYAERLASRGHPLLLAARRIDRLEALAARLREAHGVAVETLAVDLEDAAQLASLEARLASEPVALLVNNAGAGGLGALAATTADQLERTIRLNITALTRLSHAALAGFRVRGSGTLVNIGSVMAHAPSPAGAVYSGSKAYVLNFTRSLQLEYAGTGIRVQLVMPGPIRTEFFTSQGMSDAVFPDSAFLTAEQLVDAALAGLDAGEDVTVPSVGDTQVWAALEAARQGFMAASISGAVADRYR
jgi:short-subunit dehydrogenase